MRLLAFFLQGLGLSAALRYLIFYLTGRIIHPLDIALHYIFLTLSFWLLAVDYKRRNVTDMERVWKILQDS